MKKAACNTYSFDAVLVGELDEAKSFLPCLASNIRTLSDEMLTEGFTTDFSVVFSRPVTRSDIESLAVFFAYLVEAENKLGIHSIS